MTNPVRPRGSDLDNPNPPKHAKVEEAPKPICSEWFAAFVKANGEQFQSDYKTAITDLPFYKYYSSVMIDSRVKEIIRHNIDMLGQIGPNSRLSCSNDGRIKITSSAGTSAGASAGLFDEISSGISHVQRMISQSPEDRIQNLRIFSIFLTKCPNNVLCSAERFAKANQGLSILKDSYATKNEAKAHKVPQVEIVIKEFEQLIGKLTQKSADKLSQKSDRAPYNLDSSARDFVFQMDVIGADPSLDEAGRFMKAHSILSHHVEVLFTRDNFPKIYEVDRIIGEIFPRWPRWAFIMWNILKKSTASPIKDYNSEPKNQYSNFLHGMRSCEVDCQAFIEQREPIASLPKATKVTLEKRLFNGHFKGFLECMEKAEKQASEQAAPDKMTVKIGFALFQLAGGVAAMASGIAPLEVIGNYATGKSFETLVDSLLKSQYFKNHELDDVRTTLEKLMKEKWTNPAEAMTKFGKAFTAEMEKLKEAHDAYEEMKKFCERKPEGKE